MRERNNLPIVRPAQLVRQCRPNLDVWEDLGELEHPVLVRAAEASAVPYGQLLRQ